MNDYLICDDCKKQDETVTEGNCPFMADVNNIDSPATLCRACYSERCMDI